MPIPSGVETVTVSSGEPLTTPDGSLMRGHIRFVAPDLAVAPSDNYTLGGEAVAELVNGEFSIVLVAPDATGINPTGWTYTVIGEFTNAPDWTTFALLTKDQPNVFLSDVIEAEAIEPAFSTIYLRRDGGTMTGDLVLNDATPDTSLSATPKTYVDTADAQNVKLTGNQTIAGIKTFSSIPVGPASDPSTANQLTRKAYVDAADSALDNARIALADQVATLDAQNVKLTGNQSVSGTKTFTGTISVTDGVNLNISDVREALAAVLSTGVIRGGQLNASPANPTTQIEIEPVVGYIVDYVPSESSPLVKRISTSSVTTVPVSNMAAPITWFSISSDGSVFQQTTQPTAEDYDERLHLGYCVVVSGAIVDVQTLQGRITQSVQERISLLGAIGSFSVRGEEPEIAPNGANLQLNNTTGKIFARGISLYDNDILQHERNVFQYNAASGISFRRVTQLASSFNVATSNVLDPGQYDVGGVLTTVPNPTSSATVLRVYTFPLTNPADRFYVQYGQTVYGSLDEAIGGVGVDDFVINPLLKFSTLLMYIAVTKGATSLIDPAQARFRQADRFQLR